MRVLSEREYLSIKLGDRGNRTNVFRYGLPNDFATKMKILGSKSRFYYNLRGHDFLSFSGQWRSRIGEFDVRHVETARTLITESSLMGSVHSKNHGRGFEGLNMVC